MWFENLTGFAETSPEDVRSKLQLSGTVVKSLVNQQSWECGSLELVPLSSLRDRAGIGNGTPLKVSEVVADVQALHTDPVNAGALFQVASQFNLLEMVSPGVTPEQGVGIYEEDFTQGPACAIAAGAGTIYRNYFAETHGQTGQSASNQIDGLEGIGDALGNVENRLWSMQNGYALANANGLDEISTRLQSSTPEQLDDLRGLLKIGFQQGTQVTLYGCRHLVSQVYCSALPVAYSHLSSSAWKYFAVMILEAAYEATLCAGVINALTTGNNTVFLTLLGGGAFGNQESWIVGAIDRALKIHENSGLDVRIVSYGYSNPLLSELTA